MHDPIGTVGVGRAGAVGARSGPGRQNEENPGGPERQPWAGCGPCTRFEARLP